VVHSQDDQTATIDYVFVVDSGPPVVTLVSPENGETYGNGNVTVVYTIDHPGDVAEQIVTLDGDVLEGFQSGDNLPAILPGTYTLEVSVVDLAGNVSTPVNSTFTVEEPPASGGAQHGSCLIRAIRGDIRTLRELLACIREQRQGWEHSNGGNHLGNGQGVACLLQGAHGNFSSMDDLVSCVNRRGDNPWGHDDDHHDGHRNDGHGNDNGHENDGNREGNDNENDHNNDGHNDNGQGNGNNQGNGKSKDHR
jgi:hypothetical protein